MADYVLSLGLDTTAFDSGLSRYEAAINRIKQHTEKLQASMKEMQQHFQGTGEKASTIKGYLENLGNAFGHVALGVADAYAACEQIKARGGKVVREAGPMKHGTTVIAFVEDPDGYRIELIQTKSAD